MIKNTKSGRAKPAALPVLQTPGKNFSDNSLMLSASTPAESKGRTWADVVSTPPLTRNSQVTSRALKESHSELSHDVNVIRTLEVESPARSRSDSGYSFQSLQTIMGDVGFNTQILLTIDPEKKENQVSLYFTSLRPKTILGAAQGHHVISHRLILEFCSKIALNSRLVDIPEKIKTAFESVMPDIQDLGAENELIYPSVPDAESYPRCDQQMSNMLEELGLDHREAYEAGMRQRRANKVVCYLSDMLAYYNTLPDVTYARTEGGGINQGLEHSTIVALNAISYFLTLDKPVTSDQKQEFYRQAVKENGEFVDGMIRIFDNPITNVRKNFKGAGKEDKFFDAFNSKTNDSALMGKLMEGLFDFPKMKNRKEKQLTLMSRRCIDISLLAFPELQVLDKEEIAKGFLENVSVKQGWAFTPRKVEKIAREISDPTNEVRPVISISRK